MCCINRARGGGACRVRPKVKNRLRRKPNEFSCIELVPQHICRARAGHVRITQLEAWSLELEACRISSYLSQVLPRNSNCTVQSPTSTSFCFLCSFTLFVLMKTQDDAAVAFSVLSWTSLFEKRTTCQASVFVAASCTALC